MQFTLPADARHTSSDRRSFSRLAVRDEVHTSLSWLGIGRHLREMAINISADSSIALVDREQRRRRNESKQNRRQQSKLRGCDPRRRPILPRSSATSVYSCSNKGNSAKPSFRISFIQTSSLFRISSFAFRISRASPLLGPSCRRSVEQEQTESTEKKCLRSLR